MRKLLAAALLLAAFAGQEARATDCSNSAATPCGALQDDAIYHYDLFLGVAGTFTGSVTFAGATSGSVKITPQAAAGTSVVLTMPNASGTIPSTATSPLVLNTTTGALSLTVTGSGNAVLATSPSISGLTVTSSFTATGLVANASLANMAAASVKCNATSSSAVPTDCKTFPLLSSATHAFLGGI